MAVAPRVLACLLVCTANPVRAQQAEGPVQRQPAADGTQPQRSVELTWTDRPTLTFGDALRVSLRGRFQFGVVPSTSDIDAPGSSDDLFQRRIGIDGNVAGMIDFEVSRELDDSRPWRDVYADYRQFDTARVQAGRFKIPFSLDENTGGGSLDFVSRSMAASALAPGRDQGVMLHGRMWGRALSYEAGVFAHDGDNARARNELSHAAGRTAAFRVSTAIGGKSGLHAAAAVASSEVPATVWTIRGRTALEETFFPAALWVQGRRQRLGLEARWAGGPVTVQSEYIRLTQERLGQDVQGDLAAVTASGWYVSGTWMVNPGRKSRKPSQAQSVLRGGRGTWEVAARLEALTFGTPDHTTASASPRAEIVRGNRDRALTLGLNWYLGPHLRLQANVIRDALHHAVSGEVAARPSYWSSVLRLQVAM